MEIRGRWERAYNMGSTQQAHNKLQQSILCSLARFKIHAKAIKNSKKNKIHTNIHKISIN